MEPAPAPAPTPAPALAPAPAPAPAEAVSLADFRSLLQTRRVGVRGETRAHARVSVHDVIARMRREGAPAPAERADPGAPPRLPRALFTLAARRGIAVTQHFVDVQAIRSTECALQTLGAAAPARRA